MSAKLLLAESLRRIAALSDAELSSLTKEIIAESAERASYMSSMSFSVAGPQPYRLGRVESPYKFGDEQDAANDNVLDDESSRAA